MLLAARSLINGPNKSNGPNHGLLGLSTQKGEIQ